MFSTADMLKFANMTTKELKEVLKDNGVSYSKMNKAQMQEAVLDIWKHKKGRESKESLKVEDKELRDEVVKYKGYYDKYRKLFTELRYKHNC